MQSDDQTDPIFRSKLQAEQEVCDFVYAEQYDTPLYDFLILGVQQGVLRVLERVDLCEESRQFAVTAAQQARVLSIQVKDCESAAAEDRGSIYGGTWIGLFSKRQAIRQCFKLEHRTDAQRAAFLKVLSPLTDTLLEVGVLPKRIWQVFPRMHAAKPAPAPNMLVVDMALPVRVRKIALDLGVQTAADFAKVDERSILARLSGSEAEKAELMEQLKAELQALGIAMLQSKE